MIKAGWIWVAALWIGACGLASAASPQPPAQPSALSAQAVGGAVQMVRALARKAIADKAAPGLAIGVVFNDKLIYAEGFGVRNITSGQPVDADTVFQLASVSKPLSSTVVAELVGEKKIAWDFADQRSRSRLPAA